MTIEKYLDDLYHGRFKHLSMGYPKLDDRFGGLRRNTFSLVGAYSGVGKTFFAINLVNNLLKQSRVGDNLKIGIFSTEMSNEDYEARWLAMRLGIYQLDLERNLQNDLIKDAKFKEAFEALNKLRESQKDRIKITIHGMTNKFTDIVEIQKTEKYDLLIIDFIQDVIIQEKYKQEDTMPILTQEIMKLVDGNHVMALSQVNNKNIENPALMTFPYAFGVEMSRKSALNIYIKFYREKDGKVKTRKNTDFLDFHVMKNRYGQEGHELLIKGHGHRFSEPANYQREDFKTKLTNKLIY